MSDSDVTYEDIHNLLTSLGFDWELRTPERKSLGQSPRETVMYRHPQTGSVLFFPSKEPQRALDGDLASLRVHLVGRGHLEEEAFEAFLLHGVAAAGS
jgi:hypothetical protein